MRLDRLRDPLPVVAQQGVAHWRRVLVVTVAVLAAGLGLLPGLSRAQDPLEFDALLLPEAVKGQPYDDGLDPPSSVFITATGGVPPYSFRLLGGLLPQGMQIATTGILFGTPAICETAVFQVQVVDSLGQFINGTFLLPVTGNGNLTLPPVVNLSVEAGQVGSTTVDLTNSGCGDVRFSTETVDGDFVPPPAAMSQSALQGVAGQMALGGPLPRTLGRVQGPRRQPNTGWSLDAHGRLRDAEGNLVGNTSSVRSGLQPAAAVGQISILYVNEAITVGEIERFEALGFLVVESVVPQALDLDVLRVFDVLYLTAASDAAFPSREVIRRYVWEGGGLVIGQVQIGGDVPLLPPGYGLESLAGPPGGDNDVVVLTLEGGVDPMTAPLFDSDLASNFDTTNIQASGERWLWLAGQNDQRDPLDNLQIGSLARASYGAGQIIYHSGNFGTLLAPGALAGTDPYVFNLIEAAASGTARFSCRWLRTRAVSSAARPDVATPSIVGSLELTGDTVSFELIVDATRLPVGTHSCQIVFLTDEPGKLEDTVLFNLTVTAPAVPTITLDELAHANPGEPYGDTLSVAGGTPPYTFELIAGVLPDGLTLNSAAGSISGTPTAAGVFAPTFRVTDSLGAFTERLVRMPAGFLIATEALPDAIIAQIYVEPIFATGGVPPYSFRLEEGIDFALPVADPNSPAAQACTTVDLGGGLQSTHCDLPVGTYRVSFGAVEGLFGPTEQDVTLSAGSAVAVTGAYLTPGSVTVTSNLPEANYLLIGDTPAGEIQRFGAGTLTAFLALRPGAYTVSFNEVLGFVTPPEATGTLVEGGTLDLAGDYQLLPAAISVRVNLFEPSFAVTGVTVAGESVTLNGVGFVTIFPAQPAGLYTVTFNPLDGFITPAPQSGTLTTTSSLEFEADYIGTTGAALLAGASTGPLRGAFASSPPLTIPAAGSEPGFGTGVLTVDTNAAGATFRLVGQGAPSGMTLIEPAGTIGNGASFAGTMLNLTDPFLSDGQSVPVVVVAEDSASPPNVRRQAYALRVFDLPTLNAIQPRSAAQSFVFDLEVIGPGLRPGVDLSLGSGLTIDPSVVGPSSSGALSLFAEVRVDADAVVSRRDLIYTDTSLSGTALGSTTRLRAALEMFTNLNNTDLDASGRVDGHDLARLARAFGLSLGDIGFDPALDFTRDGAIDGGDLSSLATVFGRPALAFDESDLPLPGGVLGVPYEIAGTAVEVDILGRSGVLSARLIGGIVPDGMEVFLAGGFEETSPAELRFEGIPAEVGTFQFTVQIVDTFFSIVTRQFTLVVDPVTP